MLYPQLSTLIPQLLRLTHFSTAIRLKTRTFKSLMRLRTSLIALLLLPALALADVPLRPDRTHIVFGYMQSTGPNAALMSYRWHALTHVGYTFVSFTPDGSLDPKSRDAFRNRSPELKAGGAAANNGVRVIAVLNNRGFKADVIESVLTSPERRARLIKDVVALVTDPDSGCDGISLDFEPMNFKPATASGFDAFVNALADQLHALSPRRELSMYVGIYHAERYRLATFRDKFDYILYSAYNFAPDDKVGDVGLVSGTKRGIDSWLRAGIPPRQIVLTLALFGKQWDTAKAEWGAAGKTHRSIGMDYGNFLTTTRKPPLTAHTDAPDRTCVWTAEPFGNKQYHLSTFDDLTSHVRKLRLALSWDGEVSKGASLGGVGFWSLMWLAQGLHPGSVDPNQPDSPAKPEWRRTYAAPWTMWEELFAPAAQKSFRAANFEALTLDPLWTASATAPDSEHADSTCGIASIPSPAGASTNSHRVAALHFAFSAAPGRLLCKYRPLADDSPGHPLDRNALLVTTSADTGYIVPIYIPKAAPGATIRLVVADSQNELERSPAFPLDQEGWQQLRWNLADKSTISAYPTKEKPFQSGDGRLDTAGSPRRDIAFIGFEIQSTRPLEGTVDIDQILYAKSPAPKQ